jgi:pyridoxal phosphate enzyme (YggS family)
MTDARSEEIRPNLTTVRAGIAQVCHEVGREASEVTLVAITKTWPAEDVRRLAALGVLDVGENRDQEASTKAAACTDLPVRWHFVGQLQTNKVRSVVHYADVVHSVDRLRLVRALDHAAGDADRRIAVLLQVSLDQPTGRQDRGGVAPEGVADLAASVAATESLDLRGVMGVAPPGMPSGPAFARLAEVSTSLRSAYPEAAWISAGMTHDHLEAIRHGATHVRIGSALLGNRPPLR